MANLDKPIVSAISGVAVGAERRWRHGRHLDHVGNGAHLRQPSSPRRQCGRPRSNLWPLLCGMAKAKYYLLTAEFIDGKGGERIGLVGSARRRIN